VRTIDVESGRILRIERGLSPLETLGGLLARFGLAQGDDAPDLEGPPFQGGFIGYLGYDIAPLIERLPRRHPPDSTLPDIRLALYDTFAAVDHEDGVTTLIACDLVGDGPRATRERLADMPGLSSASAHWGRQLSSRRCTRTSRVRRSSRL
jgi:para-aminobenzoate synthetase component 1